MKKKPVHPTYEDTGQPIIVEERRRTYLDFMTVHQNPYRIREMGVSDVDFVLNHSRIKQQVYYYDRDTAIKISPIRKQLVERKKALIKARKDMVRRFNMEDYILLYYDMCKGIVRGFEENNRNIKRTIKNTGTLHRNIIYDLTCIPLGYVSVNGVRTHLPISKLTKEHVIPRTRAATRIITLIFDSQINNIQDFITEIMPLCSINYTTKTENKALEIHYSNNPDDSPQQGYKACDIQLIETQTGFHIPWQWQAIAERYHVDVDQITFPRFDVVDPTEI